MSAVEPLVLAHVIWDVLDPFTPTISLRITYNNRLLLAGAELKPSAVVSRPRLDVGGTDLRVFYTLVLVDPDAPSPTNPSLREYLHWMVIDIPGTTGATFGQELMFYENQNQDLASTVWYLCCSGNLVGGRFLQQICGTTLTAETLHANTIWTLWLPHISTVKGKQDLAEEGSGPKVLKGQYKVYRPLHGLSIVKVWK